MATLGIEESGHCGEMETRVNIMYGLSTKKMALWTGGYGGLTVMSNQLIKFSFNILVSV